MQRKKDSLGLEEAGLRRELQSLRRLRAEAAALARKTGYLSDELIADRRAEVVREAEEGLHSLQERGRTRLAPGQRPRGQRPN